MIKQKSMHIGKLIVLSVFITIFLAGCDSRYLILNPQGAVAQKEYHLIIFSIILCTIVVIPVLGLLVYIVLRYRDKPGNKAPYRPDWDDSKRLEFIWWGIPIIIIGILGFATAKTTYDLVDPPQKDVKPLTIEVTSLDWKWLFQYPDQDIATVNYVNIPKNVPVQFVLTSDAPMNSFWVPQLGGQLYTMPGMAMGLWLQANHKGKYFGSGANFTGEGFAHMNFKVKSTSTKEFNQWVRQVKETAPALTKADYNSLAKHGLSLEKSYSTIPKGLFQETVIKNGGQYYSQHHHMKNEDMKTMNVSSEEQAHTQHEHQEGGN
ncbi:cytochrome c oxidase subunit II transmembrane domain-containing protein [Priestia megaterium]|uniref:Quinol oxidase subunit 2 n=2 Tax=Bacillaceae TaxID=186817 RepID=A0ABD5KRW1_PRIAR|nr:MULTISPECIES: cytochrome c oxidase subunit II transmembrane domain-containing protein [Priestia]MEB4884553.1 cytochrome c oxidase subunit II transmembrane domain-containing protein [Priestia megaterium]MED4044696.1 cytochrome c oxidase subunit II transmembrane domain-containing protein [Priestia aryabhattai]MED5118770.1 cytochrome c oxidase subunit II transmembrane domain-containing protein [Priestia megaterium]